MSATLKMNVDEFNRVLKQVAASSSRTYPQFINGQALALASQAIKQTEKANAAKIVSELGKNAQGVTKISVGKNGKQRTKTSFKYSVDENTLAARIVNARLVQRGEKLIWGSELKKAARRMIGARVRAAGFIRSGWVWSIRTLAASVGYRPSASERAIGKAKGYAIPARSAISAVVSAEIGNTALLQDTRTPLPIAERGLQLAMGVVARDMLDHLAKKLQPVLDKHSAK